MLCLTCSVEMRLMQALKDPSALVEGYEHQTWRCEVCGEVEQRTLFKHACAPVESVLDATLNKGAHTDALRAPERAWRRAMERLHQHQEFLKQRSEERRRAERRAKWRAEFDQAWAALI
jgi:hypothetical protein